MGPPRPLLYPPPSPPASPPTDDDVAPRRRGVFVRFVSLLPLFFIAALLAFAFYTFFISICITHLLVTRRSVWAIPKALTFLWLWGGCGGAVFQCYWRGGGSIAGARRAPPKDEEERFGQLSEEQQPFVLASDSASDDENEAQEGANLLSKGERGKLEARPARARSRPAGGGQGGRGFGFADALRELDERQRPVDANNGGMQAKSNGKMRYCRKCDVPKPDRTHHCSICRACVPKMDHHCPWLGGGCVGWANYKFFLLFLWYGAFLGLYVGISTIYELSAFVEEGPDNFELAPISWALVMLLGLIFGVALLFFGLYHLYLAARNRTTIESMEVPTSFTLPTPPGQPPIPLKSAMALTRVERRKLQRAGEKLHIYDLGTKKNLAQIFGGWEDRYIWAMPWGWPPGDGTSFPVDEEKLAKLRRITMEVLAMDGRASTSEYSDSSLEYGSEPASSSEEERHHRRRMD